MPPKQHARKMSIHKKKAVAANDFSKTHASPPRSPSRLRSRSRSASRSTSRSRSPSLSSSPTEQKTSSGSARERPRSKVRARLVTDAKHEPRVVVNLKQAFQLIPYDAANQILKHIEVDMDFERGDALVLALENLNLAAKMVDRALRIDMERYMIKHRTGSAAPTAAAHPASKK